MENIKKDNLVSISKSISLLTEGFIYIDVSQRDSLFIAEINYKESPYLVTKNAEPTDLLIKEIKRKALELGYNEVFFNNTRTTFWLG